MSTLHEEHMRRVIAVNGAETTLEHQLALAALHGFRDGAEAAGRAVNLLDADYHYLDLGSERPMCCGVFLDWQPKETV